MKYPARISAISILLIVFVGCESKPSPENYDIITTSSGLVYRINKRTGELSLIVGAQITKLNESREYRKEEVKKTPAKEWPVQSIKHLGDLALRLKTTWRGGKLQYILSVSPYSLQLQKERERPSSEARFTINFYDSDGFDQYSLSIKVSELTGVVDDSNKTTGMQINSSVPCAQEVYEAFGVVNIGWGGFQRDYP